MASLLQLGAEPAPEPVAVPYAPLQERFHAYGDQGAWWRAPAPRTWTGGDSTYSVPLPDGRTVWVFSDTFLAPTDGCAGDAGEEPCHRRRPFTPFVNNSLVVQEADGSLSATVHGGSVSAPAAAITPPPPSDAGTFYWMGDGTVEGDRLHLFVRRYPKAPVLSPTALATDVATFRLPELELEAITEGAGPDGIRPWAFLAPPAGSVAPVTWGAAVLEDGGHTYVYGTEEYPLAKHLHVARAPAGRLLTSPWEYFDGQGWSTDPLASARVLDDVAGELSVVRTVDGYRLVTSRLGIGEILLSTAPAPQGPWGAPTVLLRPPEQARGGLAYNSHEHPQLSGPGRIVLSYNVNGELDGDDVYDDVHVYRPRFVEVRTPSASAPLPIPPAAAVQPSAPLPLRSPSTHSSRSRGRPWKPPTGPGPVARTRPETP